ncbi:Asp23/Gls24 family envelope stress response protein [Microlunatus capsulatus]|uniref:Alkaline shock family protein YloU n=1 Tax=Microlunatus capsulatus TaxID=99117 RepID=A0ABS4Z4A6_9ACTN|nr:Asp23/Gls24 family envelope stress response protein [Microlunatus capsulatus]MBP2415884.1 putative alkaline shock family protein YloU [Microlunatus capsulatus]
MSEPTRLGCGRDADEVWEGLDEPPGPHEQQCPFCQAARASLDELSTATAAMTAADRADPALRTSSSVLDGILGLARVEVRRGRRLPLERPAADELTTELTVSEQAVVGVVWATGDAVPGVQARRCRVELVEQDPADEGDRVRVRVVLGLSVSAAVAIPAVTAELRRRVVEEVDRQVGVEVVSVDLRVEDVHDV